MFAEVQRFWARRRNEWGKLVGCLRHVALFFQQESAARRLKLRDADELVVFFVPTDSRCNGGLMSITVLASETRKVEPGKRVALSLYPDREQRFLCNPTFPNAEPIIPFKTICRMARPRKVILHVPEYATVFFTRTLSARQVRWLKAVPELQVNILNQNIGHMPPRESWESLFDLTGCVTQTTAHARYSTQEVCDRYGVPLHRFSTYSDHAGWPFVPFARKERIIVISPDRRDEREAVLDVLRRGLPDYRIVEVHDMTFLEYLELISKALFTISFGEGFDGYFCQPAACGSLSFAVYNAEFFPGEDWQSCDNVYGSWQELCESIVRDVRKLESDGTIYETIRKDHLAKLARLYDYAGFRSNLNRFYRGEYDFAPRTDRPAGNPRERRDE